MVIIIMAYFNDKLLLVSDSLDNINFFRLNDGKIIQHYFDNKLQVMSKKVVAKEAFLEYDASIDEEDGMYLVHQNMHFDLVLTLLKDEEIETIKLTGEPGSEVYYLNIISNGKEIHIFYSTLLAESEKQYRIYHHYFNGADWMTNIIDEINVRELLNPLRIINNDKELIIAYYDKIEDEQIYMKSFDFDGAKWGEKIKLTQGESSKLYVDILLKEDKLNLVYSEYYEGNLIVKYERFSYTGGNIQEEKEEILSNPENPQEPILIYYNEKLWVVWVEYENVMSRYSIDKGTTWSPIYLWNESKDNDIVRYKYCNASNVDNNILNHSFGKIHPEITFLGFGSLDNTTQIPLKKKTFFNIPRF